MTWFGASSTFSASTAIIVAAGGGGAAYSSGYYGGNGGGSTGAAGVDIGYYGGAGGTQIAGGAAGYNSPCDGGSNPGAGSSGQGGNSGSARGGGGGGGYYGGGGGGDDCSYGGAGGGGSSYLSSSLTNAGTVSGSNAGSGWLILSWPSSQPLSSLNQYHIDGVTPIPKRSNTSEGTVIFGANLNSTGTSTLQLQVEVQPVGNPFTNIPNVSSSPSVSPGSYASTSFTGLNGSYHWQARWIDAHNNTSTWQIFGLMTTATDFTFVTAVTESYTGSVASFTVPPHVIGLSITANGAAGISGQNTNQANGGGGGNGGQVTGILTTNPGNVYYYYVGGQSGVGGGGSGGVGGPGNNQGVNGGSGGDSTWFSTVSTLSTSTAILAAGGGGGGGAGGWSAGHTGGNGGTGGGVTGGNGGAENIGGTSGGAGGTLSSNAVGGSGYNTGGSGLSESGAGGGGAWGANGGGSDGGGGGGGGASFIASTSTLMGTSTSAGVNSGNGSLVITEIQDVAPRLTGLAQANPNGITINEGSSTNQNTIQFSGTLNSYFAKQLQLQVEVEPAGTGFANMANATSAFVAPGTVATATWVGVNGSYHWQVRGIDAQNNTSSWVSFGPSSTSTDFIIAYPTISFTVPANGTTTPNFSNWQLNAQNVTSTTNYQLQVLWDDTKGDPIQSSTINASGTALVGGVNVPKTTFVGDYTFDGDPVLMNATATLSAASTTVATTTVSFTEQTTAYPVTCGSTTIQCITYRYDKNGNITQVIDNSATSASKTVNYTYDGLNRLITASSSNAGNNQNYLQTFTYDPVGNLLTGPEGTYHYNGAANADPDAVTSITNGTSTTTFTYDNNGNLTNASSGFTYGWDWDNHLLTAFGSGATSTYGYDYTGERVQVAASGITTAYPEATYNVSANLRTKNIFANGTLIATITNSTSTVNNAALVQQATSSISSGTSITTTFGSNPHSGDMLVLTLGGNPTSSTISSVSGGGVTWTKAVSSNSNRDAEIWYGLNSSGSGKTVTSTLAVACSGICIVNLSEWSGVVTSSAIDATASKHGNSVILVPSPTSTTANANDLIIATERGATASALTAGPTNGLTALSSASSSNGNSAYGFVVATGSYATSWTFTASTSYDSVISAFKATTSTIATTTTAFIATDPLGGSNVVTNTSGTVIEVLDYYPFGGVRIDNTTSSYPGEQRKYIGQQYDAATQLSYLNARFYNASRGQFISQDAVFLEVPMAQNVVNPQSLNAYAYALDNPITGEDPTGNALSDFQTINTNASQLKVGDAVGSYEGVVIHYNANDTGSFECTKFVTQYIQQQWGLQPTGSNIPVASDFNAATLNAAFGTNGFTTSLNGAPGNSLPTENSVITFGPGTAPGTGPGHVAIIGAVSFDPTTKKGSVTIAQQNTDPRVFEDSLLLTQNSNGAYVVGGFSTMQVTGWTSYNKSSSAGPAARAQGASGSGSGGFSVLSSLLQSLSNALSALLKLL